MAPEMVDKKEYDSKIDVWSLGILTYVLASGNMPFVGDTDEDIMVCSSSFY
jgi:serine/threonine protein kinase